MSGNNWGKGWGVAKISSREKAWKDRRDAFLRQFGLAEYVSTWGDDATPNAAHVLWIRVIVQSITDWVRCRDETSPGKRRYAEDAHRWLFDSTSENPRSFLWICTQIGVPAEKWRNLALQQTPYTLKRLNFVEHTLCQPQDLALEGDLLESVNLERLEV
jgi:hypothetical protein